MLKNKFSILFLLFVLNHFWVQGQTNSEKTSIITVLDEISTTHNVTFNYESQLTEKHRSSSFTRRFKFICQNQKS